MTSGPDSPMRGSASGFALTTCASAALTVNVDMLNDPMTESDNPITVLRTIDVFMISLTFWCEIRIRDRFQKGKLED
jgi:predicted Kef-type K+ transport protein